MESSSITLTKWAYKAFWLKNRRRKLYSCLVDNVVTIVVFYYKFVVLNFEAHFMYEHWKTWKTFFLFKDVQLLLSENFTKHQPFIFQFHKFFCLQIEHSSHGNCNTILILFIHTYTRSCFLFCTAECTLLLLFAPQLICFKLVWIYLQSKFVVFEFNTNFCIISDN